MKYLISGTDRPGSRTRAVCEVIQRIYRGLGEDIEIIDLANLGLQNLTGALYGSANLPEAVSAAIERVNRAEALIIVCPEYNGSMPGALKFFIDFWKYPESFESRPVAFVGLGGRFGGLRPVEHLQGVFGYRNAYIFPIRVFIMDVWNTLKDGQIQDSRIMALLEDQAKGFRKFVRALQAEKLDANSVLESVKRS